MRLKLLAVICLFVLVNKDTAKAEYPIFVNLGKVGDIYDLNNSDNILYSTGFPSYTSLLWKPNGTTQGFTNPLELAFCGVNAISETGAGVGTCSFPAGNPGGTPPQHGAFWPPGGSGIDLGVLNSRLFTTPFFNAGESQGYAISSNGIVAGGSTFCRGPGEFENCSGYLPVVNQPFTRIGPSNPPVNDNGYVYSINASGVAVGIYDEEAFGQGSKGVIFSNGGFTRLTFTPRIILDNGIIYGNNYGATGVIMRTTDGTVKDINCGQIVHSANIKGDVITNCGSSLCIYHEEQCFTLSQVLPAGFKSFQTPTRQTGPSINDLGRVATMAVPNGQSTAVSSNYVGIFFTPEYPLEVSVSATPTGTPGEYDFKANLLVGNNPSGNVTWEFTDPSGQKTSETSFGIGTLRKKFTKPGKYTAKAKITNSTNQIKTGSIDVDVPAPSLKASVTVPAFSSNKIPLNSDARIDVQVLAGNDGVGDLSDLAFQGGIFTVDNSEPLSFTTAATSPFSLSPGNASTFSVNVKAKTSGEVKVRSLIIGKDAAGSSVSASAEITITVEEGDGSLSISSSPDLKLKVSKLTDKNEIPVNIENKSKATMSLIIGLRASNMITSTLLSTEKKYSLKKSQQKDIKLKLGKEALDQLKTSKKLSVFVIAKIIDTKDTVLFVNNKSLSLKLKKN